MRLIKMFGLAAIAAVAAMAFVGASSASAESTTLCTVNTAELGCPAASQATSAHFVDPAAQLLNSLQNVVCNALFQGTIANPLGSPLVTVGNLTYTNCTPGCSAQQVSANATITALKTGAELASVTGTGEVLVQCTLIFHCVYNGESLVGHGLGGNTTPTGNGHVTFVEQTVNKTGGLFCPNTAKLDALFVSLEPLYLRS